MGSWLNFVLLWLPIARADLYLVLVYSNHGCRYQRDRLSSFTSKSIGLSSGGFSQLSSSSKSIDLLRMHFRWPVGARGIFFNIVAPGNREVRSRHSNDEDGHQDGNAEKRREICRGGEREEELVSLVAIRVVIVSTSLKYPFKRYASRYLIIARRRAVR